MCLFFVYKKKSCCLLFVLYCWLLSPQSGGVLKRGGHTEAALDLAKLAGLSPVGVLCEITTKDGKHMARCVTRFVLCFLVPAQSVNRRHVKRTGFVSKPG